MAYASPISTGLADLDELTDGGYHPGRLTLITGITGIGKTAMALTGVLTAIRAGTPTLMLTPDATSDDTLSRLASNAGRVLLDRPLDAAAAERLAEARREITAAPLHVFNEIRPAVGYVATKIRQFVDENDIRLVVVDPVQFLHADHRTQYRNIELAEVMHGLKRLAVELPVAMVVVSQLLRQPTPVRSLTAQDFGEVTPLTQAADVVVFINRPDHADKESPRVGEADLYVAKNRYGSAGRVTVAAQLHVSRFVTMVL